MAQNLRDRGYPSSKEYRPDRSEKKNLPMTKETPASKVDAVHREVRAITPKAEELMNKLITAYNNRAFGNTSAPLLTKTDLDTGDFKQKGVNVVSHGSQDLGGRLGFANKSFTPNTGVAYNVGLDNGNPNRGTLDVSLNTPNALFGGGFEGETNWISVGQPNGDTRLGAYYWGENFENPIEASAGIGASDLGGKEIYADLNAPFINSDTYNSFNTPVGYLEYGASGATPANNGYAYAGFTPNQYIQALMTLLNRGTL